jgi:hypothetical protein
MKSAPRIFMLMCSLMWIACAPPLPQQLSPDRKLDLLRIKK